MDQPRHRHLHVADLNDQGLLAEIELLRDKLRLAAIETSKVVEELSGAHDTIRAQGKEITRLKRDLTKQAKESVKAEKIEAVVEHWRSHRPKTTSAFGKPESAAYKVIDKALTLMADEEGGDVLACCEAIDGLHLAPWQEYDQRFAKPGGPKRILRCDIEHALGDEARITKCRQILKKARSDADRAWLIYEAVGWTLEAWSYEVLDLLRERRVPREQHRQLVDVDGIPTEMGE